MLRALTEPDERDFWSLAGGHSAYVLNLDLTSDQLVSERGDDRCDEREAIVALVGDQDAQMVGLTVADDRLHPDQV